MPSLYPLDTSGNAASNLVVDELHTTNEAHFRDYFFLVPIFAPFFVDNFSLKMNLGGVITELSEGPHYSFALEYVAGTRSTGKPMYGAISLNNINVSALLSITYQTLGGDWVVDRLHVLNTLAEKLYNPKTTTWDVITDKPEIFPPEPHFNDYNNFYGLEEEVQALNQIRDAIANGSPLAVEVRNLLLEVKANQASILERLRLLEL